MGSFYVVMCVAALIVAGQCRAQVPVSRNQPIAPAIAPGQLPDSMFGSSGGRNPADNPRLVALGAKWLRESGTVPDDVATKEGFNQLLIVGFWNLKPEDKISVSAGYSAPKEEAVDRLVAGLVDKLKLNPQITAVEFYNEHWWMYNAASMARFRDDLRKFYLAVKAYNPKIIVLCGNTPSAVQDDLAINGGEKYCDGFAPHNYVGNEALSYQSEPFWRPDDWSYQQAVKYDKKINWWTEGGEWRLGDRDNPGLVRPLVTMAYKLTQVYAVNPFTGIQKTFAFMHDDAWSSPEMYAGYQIQATLLEGKKPVKEIWPASMLTWGSVFEGNGQSVAVLWSYLGHDPLQTDAGQVVIHNAANIYCYDVMGKPYGHYDDRARTLTFDVGNPTLYLASSVSGRDLAKAVDGADITLNEPVKAMIEPLTGPAGEATPINVRLYNGGVREATGTVDVTVPGFSIAKSISFDVAPGKFDVVAVPVISASANTSNIYNATVTVTTKNAGSAVNVAQPFQAAYMTRFTPTIDGDLSDWAGKAPVTMATYEKGLDWGALALNPALFNQAQADGKPPIQNALIRLYTAYDDKNLYIAYELTGKQSPCDWVQLGLGVTDWNPRNVRPKSDPWAYKGHFYDNDYLFAINDPAGQVWRLAAPDAQWRTPYNWIIQCKGGDAEKNVRFVSDPDYESKVFYDLVAKGEAELATKDDGNGRRTVECAIPRALIPEFKPTPGKPIRLSFIFHQGSSVDSTTYYEWAKVAGEFAFLRGNGFFVPSWQMLYPNELNWGVQ